MESLVVPVDLLIGLLEAHLFIGKQMLRKWQLQREM